MKNGERRIAVFYPWTGLPAMDRGSARRVVPLVALLADRYEHIRVVSPGDQPRTLTLGNVEYRFLAPTAPGRVWLKLVFAVFDSAFHRLSRGRITPRERRQWWHYLSVDLQKSFKREAKRVVAWSSAVLLEYPFCAKTVLTSCAKTNRKSLLTMHDALSDLVLSSAWLRARVRGRELSAAREASRVFCVSERDCQNLAQAGITARYVPHGIDIDVRTGKTAPTSAELQQVQAARALGRTICLFVGSSLLANQEAVVAIRAMAAALAEKKEFQFAIAGACLPKGTYDHNVIAFGPTQEDLLARLYEATDIVLAPLTSGTGASLKVLEAFAHEKALVATRTGVRGYPVRDGVECLLCDEPQRYPELLGSLRADPARRRSLAEGGRSFVAAYDYRIVYQPYLECIDRFLG